MSFIDANPLICIELDKSVPVKPVERERENPAILVGIDAAGLLPDGSETFDLALTTAIAPPPPWVSIAAAELGATVEALKVSVARCPIAALVLTQVLRSGEALAFSDALLLESLAYSTLQSGTEFRNWRRSVPVRHRSPEAEPLVRFEREGDSVCLVLTRPRRRNAFNARMRDELVEALTAVLDDPSVESLALRAEGPCFGAGGDLDEFGTASDFAAAHLIRRLHSPAQLVHECTIPVTAYLHGACIGAGIEIPAAASRVIARSDAVFRLPEVSMGLIPGAGGTVTVLRRIGRSRTCYMALSGSTVDAETARAWGLVNAIDDSCFQ